MKISNFKNSKLLNCSSLSKAADLEGRAEKRIVYVCIQLSQFAYFELKRILQKITNFTQYLFIFSYIWKKKYHMYWILQCSAGFNSEETLYQHTFIKQYVFTAVILWNSLRKIQKNFVQHYENCKTITRNIFQIFVKHDKYKARGMKHSCRNKSVRAAETAQCCA